MPVDPYLTVHVYSIEADADNFALCRGRQGQGLPVPSDPCRQIPAPAPGRRILTEDAFNTVVMWQIDGPPGLVVKPRLIGMSGIARIKFPMAVQVIGQALAIADTVEDQQQASEQVD